MYLHQKSYQQYQYKILEIMSTRQEMFSTSFLLKNNVKGYLEKFKKLSISSTFKFKSKLNNPRVIQQTTIYSPQKNYSPQELSQNAKQKLSKKVRTFRIDPLHFQQSYFDKAQNPKSNKNQFQKSRSNLKQFFPIFPQIQNKKMKSSKINRITQNQQEINKNETHVSLAEKIPIEKNNRTIENGFYQKMTKQFENLIRKQVLKTQNQAILRQGHLKFDQTQAFFSTGQNRKKFGSTKKRKRRYEIENEQIKQQNPLQRFFSIQGPEARSVSLVPASLKSQQMPVLRQRLKQRSRYSYQKISTDKIKEENKNDQYANIVKGWDNQEYQNSSQVFEQDIEKQERVQHRYKSFKSGRFN